jgi:DNA mismatch repair protein MutS
VAHLTPKPLFLFNESFAATSELEGSELGGPGGAGPGGGRGAGGLRHPLLHPGGRFSGGRETLFLKAERLPDGRRTYRLRLEPPEPTAYAQDLLRQVFGEEAG